MLNYYWLLFGVHSLSWSGDVLWWPFAEFHALHRQLARFHVWRNMSVHTSPNCAVREKRAYFAMARFAGVCACLKWWNISLQSERAERSLTPPRLWVMYKCSWCGCELLTPLLGPELSDRQGTGGEDWKSHLQPMHPQNWCHPGLHPESSDLLPWLQSHVWRVLQHHC